MCGMVVKAQPWFGLEAAGHEIMDSLSRLPLSSQMGMRLLRSMSVVVVWVFAFHLLQYTGMVKPTQAFLNQNPRVRSAWEMTSLISGDFVLPIAWNLVVHVLEPLRVYCGRLAEIVVRIKKKPHALAVCLEKGVVPPQLMIAVMKSQRVPFRAFISLVVHAFGCLLVLAGIYYLLIQSSTLQHLR
jgi:hypothetical protein